MQTVSRDELYRQVWSMPLTKLAVVYGVTGTALKKTCKRHNIPTPERGYWAKLKHGKPVATKNLPKLDGNLIKSIRIMGFPASSLTGPVQSQSKEVRTSIERRMTEMVATTSAPRTEDPIVEPKAITDTRRALEKARPDKKGYLRVSGNGIVTMTIAPVVAERALNFLSQFLAIAASESYSLDTKNLGVSLIVSGEALSFSIEERPQRIAYEPTAAEIKKAAGYERAGFHGRSYPKYDQAPSGRLAFVIDGNVHSGGRRTYADHKGRKIEAMLPNMFAGFVEKAALAAENRLAREERARAWAQAEARRNRQSEFEAREKRRTEFGEAAFEQLETRKKFATLLAHLRSTSADDRIRVASMTAWVERRIMQIDALLSPLFLDLSARSAKVSFDEPPPPPNPEERYDYRAHQPPVLEYWSIDDEKGFATTITPIDWVMSLGADAGPELEAEEE